MPDQIRPVYTCTCCRRITNRVLPRTQRHVSPLIRGYAFSFSSSSSRVDWLPSHMKMRQTKKEEDFFLCLPKSRWPKNPSSWSLSSLSSLYSSFRSMPPNLLLPTASLFTDKAERRPSSGHLNATPSFPPFFVGVPLDPIARWPLFRAGEGLRRTVPFAPSESESLSSVRCILIFKKIVQCQFDLYSWWIDLINSFDAEMKIRNLVIWFPSKTKIWNSLFNNLNSVIKISWFWNKSNYFW